MQETTVSYTETLKAFANHKSLRDVGLHLLNQFDRPVNWFDSAADYAFGMAFRQFVATLRQVAPGKRPSVILLTWDGKRATVSLPSGKIAVSV